MTALDVRAVPPLSRSLTQRGSFSGPAQSKLDCELRGAITECLAAAGDSGRVSAEVRACVSEAVTNDRATPPDLGALSKGAETSNSATLACYASEVGRPRLGGRET